MAADDPSVGRFAEAADVAVANGSFADGTSQWRTGGKDDRLTVKPQGHGDAHAVTLRSTTDRRAVLRPEHVVVPLSKVDTEYRASVWVRSTSVGSSIQLRLGPAGSVGEDTSTKTRRGVVVRNRTEWYRLDVSYTTPPVTVPLTLKVVAQELDQKARRVVVDDIRLEASTPSRPGGPTPAPPGAPPAPPGPPGPPPAPSARQWMSGASGVGVASGDFGRWRGTPVPIAGTWNDNAESQVDQWTLQPGFEYGSWQGDVDVAVGAIFKDRGESWKAAATGAYDARWRSTLTNLTKAWGARPGTVYLRFAHEFNGDWYPWSVTRAEADDFRSAWRRFRALQRDLAPEQKLVFCPNSETTASSGLDWRDAFPGADQVDVLSVDYYNQYPFTTTAADFDRTVLSYDAAGAPRGLERFRQFAAAEGLPFAISEWSTNADMGDSPAFVTALRRWLTEHGGTGAGEVLYEIHFNADYGNGRFQLFPSTRQPSSTAAYRELW
ncbi:MAG: hypothetical protein LH468_08015 [Nocardioides sp.]|nr:hypothetical protein [Nocardioides sp.]